MEIRQPHSTITMGVRQPIVATGDVEGAVMAMTEPV
jgi:hypothetical protein